MTEAVQKVTKPHWSWTKTAREQGAKPDGTFNAGTVVHPASVLYQVAADGRFAAMSGTSLLAGARSIAGEHLSPAEIETELLVYPPVADVVCVGRADRPKGQVVSPQLVLSRTEPTALPGDLRRWVGDRIGWHAAPRAVVVHEFLPRTESGKLRRSNLCEQEARR